MVLIQNHYNTIKLLYRKLVQPKRARSVPYLKNYLLANYSAGAYQSRAIAPKMSQTTTTAAGFWRHTPVCMAEPPNGPPQGHIRFRRWTAYWAPPPKRLVPKAPGTWGGSGSRDELNGASDGPLWQPGTRYRNQKRMTLRYTNHCQSNRFLCFNHAVVFHVFFLVAENWTS